MSYTDHALAVSSHLSYGLAGQVFCTQLQLPVQLYYGVLRYALTLLPLSSRSLGHHLLRQLLQVAVFIISVFELSFD